MISSPVVTDYLEGSGGDAGVAADGVRAASIGRLWRERGRTLVLVTHDSPVARRAQRVAIMAKGRLSLRQSPAAESPAAETPAAETPPAAPEAPGSEPGSGA